SIIRVFSFFFFQAEDGIRDFHVTGVQTCALPISTHRTERTRVVSLWDRLKLNAAVAAAIAIVSVFSTLWLTGYYSNLRKTTSDYSALRRDMNTVKRNVNAHNAAIKSISSHKDNVETMHYGATGFMI